MHVTDTEYGIDHPRRLDALEWSIDTRRARAKAARKDRGHSRHARSMAAYIRGHPLNNPFAYADVPLAPLTIGSRDPEANFLMAQFADIDVIGKWNA